MLLASAISEKQDTVAYLRVASPCAAQLRRARGHCDRQDGVFYSKCAMAIYEALDIQKERIAPKQSWQIYIEAHFGIMRRLADYFLNQAPTLDEMKKAHRIFIRDYNSQIHFAHRERKVRRHSPKVGVARHAGADPAGTNAGPHLLCHRVYALPGSLRLYPLSELSLLRRRRAWSESLVQVSIYTSTLKIAYQDPK